MGKRRIHVICMYCICEYVMYMINWLCHQQKPPSAGDNTKIHQRNGVRWRPNGNTISMAG